MAGRVPPTVRLLFPCEYAERDPQTNNIIVHNPLAVAALPPGMTYPIDVEELWVFTQLSEGVGLFHLSVEMRQVYDGSRAERLVGRSEVVALDFPGASQLNVYDVEFRMVNVPFDEPGLYELRLMSGNDELQGQTAILRVLDLGVGL
jgi:hypothetical protein